MWIGPLYYFNFVQVPALKAAGATARRAESPSMSLRGRFLYFRWAAVVTAARRGGTARRELRQRLHAQKGYAAIGIGAWLGTIMLFNVWGLIWPNQQKILGMKPATDEEKNKARRVALLASRTNTMLSIPMLFFMAGGLTHKAAFGL